MNKETKPSFKEWIIQFRHLNSPRGDLAEDIARDRLFDGYFPAGITELDQLIAYLRYRRACEGAIRAGKYAWKVYEQKYKRV